MSTQRRQSRGPTPTPVIEEDLATPKEPFWRRLVFFIWRYRWMFLVLSTAFLVVFLAIPFAVKVSFERLKQWQASNLAQMGKEYAEKNDLKSARMSADTALTLDPQNADALRLLARVLNSEGRPRDAFEVYQKLADTGQATLPEFKAFALIASREGYISIAEWIANWISHHGETDFPYLMRADTLARQGRNVEALNELRLAVDTSDGLEAQRELARLLLATSDLGESNQEVYSLLKNISVDDGIYGHEALLVGILSGVVPTPERHEWLRRIRMHPLKDARSLTIADSVEVSTEPQSYSKVLEDIVKRTKTGSINDRILAARWLLQHGHPSKIQEILPLDMAQTHPEGFALWADAEMASGNSSRVLQALDEKLGLLPSDSESLLRALALKKCGHEAEAQVEFTKLISKTQSLQDRFLPILIALHSSGEHELFNRYSQEILSNHTAAATALPALAGAVRKDGDAVKLLHFLQSAKSSEPLAKHVLLHDQIDYFNLVLEKPVEQRELSSRAESFPDNPTFQFTLAFSQWRLGQNALALQTLEGIKIPIRNRAPQHQLITACILSANNRKTEARKISQLLSVAPLTTQERQVLKASLK